nr:MAG TPA: hypothetical protein [Caudoviricetes sp.]
MERPHGSNPVGLFSHKNNDHPFGWPGVLRHTCRAVLLE